MKFFNSLSLLVLIFVFSRVVSFAQETGGVKGKVRSTKGDGIAAATITARQDGADLKSVTADAKGNFVLDGLKTGTYNLVFSKDGYSSGVLYNVEVKKNKVGDLGGRLVLTVDQGTQVIIKGSVFAPDGRSVGGAEIKIERISEDGSVKKVGSSTASYSGEFSQCRDARGSRAEINFGNGKFDRSGCASAKFVLFKRFPVSGHLLGFYSDRR